MKTESLKYWGAVPAILIGAFIGLLVLIAMRVEYYRFMEYQPNMGPQIAYYFSPILLLAVLLVALPLEALFWRYWYAPATKLGAILIGAGYATLLSWWAFPEHWMIIFAFNPIVVRWTLGLTLRSLRTYSK